jgi:hypothetical protein
MKIQEKVERYLINLAMDYEEVAANTWLIRDEEKGLENAAIMVSEPLVIIRVKVMEVPRENREKLFEELLRLNATDLLHGAYALEGNNVILIDTLLGESMDFDEFQASLDAISLALVQHYRVLSHYRSRTGTGG